MEIPEGWTAYNGEGQPVADDVGVAVILRGDRKVFETTSPANDVSWAHMPDLSNAAIIAYKVVG